jgi:dephospho-CoA kinase
VIVIALTGPKGAGKDTVGQFIKSKYRSVITTAFADPIRKVVEDIFQLPSELRPDSYDKFKRTNLMYDLPGIGMEAVSGRRVVREIGMLMRSYNENQFTQYAEDVFRANPDSLHVITDMRFANEYEVLKRYNAKFIKIDRPDYDYDGHVTEKGFPDSYVDFIINNDGDIEKLERSVEAVMKMIV